MKKQTGKVHWITISGLAGFLLVLFFVFNSRESAQVAAARFMDALARHDVKGVAGVSYMEGRTPDQVEAAWKHTIIDVGEHYVFSWDINSSVESSSDTAAVRMMFVRDAASGSSYPEKFELPMVRKEGHWKVDVYRIDRRLFPGLPRP